MKTNLNIAIVTLIFACSLAAQTLEQPALHQDGLLKIADHDAGVTEFTFSGGVAGHWLTVKRHNRGASTERGFDPSHTNITSNFKPISHKLDNGRWETTFVSEIAENIP